MGAAGVNPQSNLWFINQRHWLCFQALLSTLHSQTHHTYWQIRNYSSWDWWLWSCDVHGVSSHEILSISGWKQTLLTALEKFWVQCLAKGNFQPSNWNTTNSKDAVTLAIHTTLKHVSALQSTSFGQCEPCSGTIHLSALERCFLTSYGDSDIAMTWFIVHNV